MTVSLRDGTFQLEPFRTDLSQFGVEVNPMCADYNPGSGDGARCTNRRGRWRAAVGEGLVAGLLLTAPPVAEGQDRLSGSGVEDPGRGKVEVRVFGGANLGPERQRFDSKAGSSFMAEAAYGLSRHLEAVADFELSRLGQYTGPTFHPAWCRSSDRICPQPDVSDVDVREWTGGVRASTPGRGGAKAYGVLLTGVVRTHESRVAMTQPIAALALDSSGGPVVKPAVGIGGGLELRLCKPLALNFDFRAIKAAGMTWFVQPSIGVGLRVH